MDHYFQLNESQIQAVRSKEKPVLVLAGPGTGKTRTLISRIEYLVKEKQYEPDRILAITFTNKAANELKERLKLSLGDKSEQIEANTFHAFCLNILRENHNFFNISRHFNIADSYYQQEIIRNFMDDPGPDPNVVKGILRGISNHKIRHLPFRNDYMRQAYAFYKKALLSVNSIDFDDILEMTRSLFTLKSDVLQLWQNAFDTILVDEFQDTDVIQYKIIRDLAINHKNIFVVGDDDQSIFAWRGADPGNIQKFIEDFEIPTEEIVILNENYRTSANIFNAALKPLAQTSRIYPDKKIHVVKEKGEEVSIKSFSSRKEEGEYISDKIASWVADSEAISFRDIAVIYPRHVVGSEIEKILLQKHIPARLASGKSLLDHPSVQKILSFLKFVNNPKDRIAFRKIVELHLNPPEFKKLEYAAYKQKINFRQAMTRAALSPVFNNLEKLKFKEILGKINNVFTRSINSGLFNLIQFILADDNKEGVFWLKNLVGELSDPLTENPDNMDSILSFKAAVAKNSRIIINSGNSDVDLLLKPILHRLIPNAATYTLSELSRLNQKGDENQNIYLQKSEIVTDDGNADDHAGKIYFHDDPVKIDSGKLNFIAAGNSFSFKLFKFLQSTFATDNEPDFSEYIILDLETTDKDIDTCEVIEIAAIKVVKGKIVDRFHRLIKPQKEISTEAQKVHKITHDMLANEPVIEEVWSDFVRFIGDNLLIAHNGVNFDFQILNRINKKLNQKKLPNVVLDTLPFARQLYPGSGNSIDALIELFDLDGGERHRAMDDVLVLKSIFERLTGQYQSQIRKTAFEELLPLVSAAIHLENNWQKPEEQIFFQIGHHVLLNRNLETYNQVFSKLNSDGQKIVDEMAKKIKDQPPKIGADNLGADKLHELIYLSKDFELQHKDIKEATSQFIQFLSLYTDAQSLDKGIDAVNLMTLHTCKGLEFEKVIIAGLEDNNLPSYWSYQSEDLDDIPVNKKHEEQRRLFYVGMTRAKSELILTCSKLNERLKEEKPSPFLQELL